MKLNKELVKGSTAMLVLSVLEKQDMYGYLIIKTVSVLSDDVFSMNEGTLYPILHALEKNGDLTAYWSDADTGTRRRRYYAITAQGKKVLAAQKQEWEIYTTAVGKVLGGASLVGA
jgi:PadR family transcriptional regulator PadR